MTVTRIVVNITRHETITLMTEGVADANWAIQTIAAGDYEGDIIDSDIHHEDVEVVSIEMREL